MFKNSSCCKKIFQQIKLWIRGSVTGWIDKSEKWGCKLTRVNDSIKCWKLNIKCET